MDIIRHWQIRKKILVGGYPSCFPVLIHKTAYSPWLNSYNLFSTQRIGRFPIDSCNYCNFTFSFLLDWPDIISVTYGNIFAKWEILWTLIDDPVIGGPCTNVLWPSTKARYLIHYLLRPHKIDSMFYLGFFGKALRVRKKITQSLKITHTLLQAF